MTKSDPNMITLKLTWQKLEWIKYYPKIAEIQDNLITAYRQGDKSKVHDLQRKIVTSFEGRALAVRKVVTNKGGKTAGVDGRTWETSDQRMNAIEKLGQISQNSKNYEASPVKRIWIPKTGTTELRPLGIPTLIDRAVQALYHMAVDPIVEEESDEHSYGFRKYRSAHDAILRIRTLLDKSTSPEWVLEADIEKCFDRISHKFLMEHTPICDKNVLRQWLKSGITENGFLNQSAEGIGTPQGGIMSPTLSNIALNGFEKFIRNHKSMKNQPKRTKIHLIRYADDFIVTGRSREFLEDTVREICEEFLEPRGLKLKEAKTSVVSIHTGFKFLGFEIRRYPWNPQKNKRVKKVTQKSLLIIRPGSKEMKVLRTKIRTLIQPQRPMLKIIQDINPLLRGWSEYYRISFHGQEVFWKISHWLYKTMWSWARKKHSKRKAQWIFERYIWEKKGTKWNFGVDSKQTIFNIGSVSNLKLVPMKEGLNPYELENTAYFEKRKQERIRAKFRNAIYRKHKHKCPHCGQSLYGEEPVELHHVVPERKGGKYTMDNIVPLHQICHQHYTHQV